MAQKTKDSNPDLLNIKEAAALLKVSEASLRRWTNSGRLACMRLGAKRERRFRREDLMSFLENRMPGDPTETEQSVSAAGLSANRAQSDGDAKDRQAEVRLEGVNIKYGSHICTLYENDLGRLKWSVPFLADGIRNGEICFLIAEKPVQDEILHHVREACNDVEDALQQGRLVLSEGLADGEAMCNYLERSLVMATHSGKQSFRLLGDMTWGLRLGMTFEELISYESRYNSTIAHRFSVVSICQYDVREFSGPAVLNALQCHEDTFNYPLSRFLGP